MVLREATAADVPTLVRLIHAAFAEYRGRLDPPSGAHRETAASLGSYLQTGHAVIALVDLGVRVALPHLQAYYTRQGYHVVRYEAHEGYAAPTSVVMEKHLA